ncbi:hypothetical protein [Sedimentitalea sp.]|uniref:hypothetical protein n=1 Tax=Sedimentitalea sp. TaxID=2048915 RepID=UPI0032973EA3
MIARNILEHGESSALLGTPTNGYHPLWMIVVTMYGSVFGFGLMGLRIFETLLFALALVILIRALEIRSFMYALLVTVGFHVIFFGWMVSGMEISLLLPLVCLFQGLMLRPDWRAGWIGTIGLLLSACAVIGTRLDAAFFVIPILLFAPLGLTRKSLVLAGLVAAAVAYTSVNLALFDTALPISGSVKSLGAPTLNTGYLEQLETAFSGLPSTFLVGDPFVTPFITAGIGICCLVIGLLPSLRNQQEFRATRGILLGATIGFLAYSAKLVFGSSWRVWFWYGYPSIFFLIPILAILHSQFGTYRIAKAVSLIAIAGLMYVNRYVIAPDQNRSERIPQNAAFYEMVEKDIGDGPVAMGDRAGTFGWMHPHGLFQLEGLVNDVAYFALLERSGNVRATLCARGIRKVVDYEPNLGRYERHDIAVLRPFLTSFGGPFLTVYGDEEVARMKNDPNTFGLIEEADSTIYLWKLDCDR